jgi:hypothetical protein
LLPVLEDFPELASATTDRGVGVGACMARQSRLRFVSLPVQTTHLHPFA